MKKRNKIPIFFHGNLFLYSDFNLEISTFSSSEVVGRSSFDISIFGF
jgi:hypothetical protein